MTTPSSSREQMAERDLILALEASGDAVSVALMQNGLCLSSKEHKARFGHAEHLVGLVSEALAEAEAEFTELTHIAAGCGPGSFTGLRVCLSAAKGYALATKAQPIGVNGLAALAVNTLSDHLCDPDPNNRVICFSDTRRQSAFVQEFDGRGQALSTILDMSFDKLPAWLEDIYERSENRPVILAGLTEHLCSHIPAYEGVIQSRQPVNAAMVAHYAAQALRAPDRFPYSGFTPLYVVPPKLGPTKHQA